MNKYISITIGPITRVINMARTTRGMWAASYLFSYVAKHLIAPFKDGNRTFLLPAIEQEMFAQKYSGAGIFPDRYIFKAEDNDFEILKKRFTTVLNDLADKIAPSEDRKRAALKQLRDRIKIYFFECMRDQEISDSDFIKQCEQRLALLEQQDMFAPTIEYDYLAEFLNGKMNRMQFLMEDAGLHQRFKSIVEISSGKDDFGQELPKFPYQRYIAIVYADGDTMGQALATPGITTVDLSSALLAFNKSAVKLIDEFDGQPVFVGGDDLFFFAPIFSDTKKQSIFSLVGALSDAFKKALDDKKIVGPTLSFGVSVTYCKFPMQEAVEMSQQLLNVAKGYSIPDVSSFDDMHYKLKNNVLFSVQKHSGHTRGALLHKGFGETYRLFEQIADFYLCPPNIGSKKEDEKNLRSQMLRSIMHNMREHAAMLEVAVTSKLMLDNYFANSYNENVHTDYAKFIEKIKELLIQAYRDYGNASASIELCYSLLQFIHLVNSKPKDETV